MNRVEISYIELKNYRQYAGRQRIQLGSTGGRRINIIEGQNGAGKSNLLNAITLCLYGEEQHGSEDSDLDSLPYASQRLLNDLDPDESVDGSIEIGFQGSGSELIFRREFTTYKVDSNEFHSQLTDLQANRVEGSDFVTIENPNTVRNNILPPSIKEYFIFDSEDLNAFFTDEENAVSYYEKIEKGVIDVSQIELLDRSIYHLNELEDDIESNLAELGGKTEELMNERDELEASINEKESQITDIEDSIADLEAEISEISERLQDADDERVQELHTQRDSKEAKRDTLEEQLDRARSEAADLIVSAGPTVLAQSAEREALSLLREVSPRDDVPTGVDQQLVADIIETGRCLCGTELSEDDDHKEHLEHLRQELTDVSNEYIEGQNALPRILDRAAERTDQVVSARRNIRDYEDDIEQLNLELNEISSELETFDIPEDVDIAALESQRQSITSDINDAQRRIGRLENELDDLQTKHKQVERQIEIERQKDDRANELDTKLDFITEAREELRTIRQRILTDMRAETESQMETYFNKLIWKSEKYDLTLDQEYRVRITAEDGETNRLGSLSAGEQQVLALSFMAAISQISGFPAPVVIDTPLGRISSKPRKLIARKLPEYLEESQITLLATDEEYTRDVEAILSSHVAHEYQLQYENEATEVTIRD